VECDGASADPKGVTDTADTEERLDRLAAQLGRTVELLQTGSGGVALKDQLAKLHRTVLEVVKDAGLDPTDVVQRDVETGAPAVPTVAAPALLAPSIPAPFRPVDASFFTAAR
jgi:hypothetical protein